MPVLNDVDTFKVGSSQVEAIFVGSTEVWSNLPPLVVVYLVIAGGGGGGDGGARGGGGGGGGGYRSSVSG